MKTLAVLVLYLSLAGAGNGFAADANFYGVIKLQQFYQTNTSAPVIAANGYSFQAFVDASSSFAITNATVKPSNTTTQHTLLPNSDGSIWRYEEPFASQSALDAVYPTGSLLNPVNYVLGMQTVNDGPRSGSVNFVFLISVVTYPTTPQIQNWSAAQTIDHTTDFKLTWNSLSVSLLAVLQLVIMDSSSNVVYSTPGPFQPGALAGSSTQTIIPAFSLPPGTNLIGHLTVANLGAPNTNAYPGAVGVAALARDTYFPLFTRPAPPAPHLNVRPPANGYFVVGVNGEPNRVFHVEASTNLHSWTNLLTTNSLSGAFEYSDPLSTTLPARFYRARIGQ